LDVFDPIDPEEGFDLDGVGRQIDDGVPAREHVQNDHVFTDGNPLLTCFRNPVDVDVNKFVSCQRSIGFWQKNHYLTDLIASLHWHKRWSFILTLNLLMLTYGLSTYYAQVNLLVRILSGHKTLPLNLCHIVSFQHEPFTKKLADCVN
jgi:hypothetical protein